MDADFFARRDELVGWIDLAASTEHALCCQYLYAAFAVKQYEEEGTPEELDCARRWKGSILAIARQEMAHLATTCNLLTALGEAPYLRRPAFPVQSHYFGVERRLDLRRLDDTFLANAIWLEKPSDGTHTRSSSLGTLYERIGIRFEELKNSGLESDLFVGSRDMQVDSALVLPTYPDRERANRQPLWDVIIQKIRNHDEVGVAINRVREEGEDRHYSDLMRIQSEVEARRRERSDFAVSRDVVLNPCYATEESPDGLPGCQLLTNATAARVAAVFDLAYEVLLRMLMLFFSPSPLTRGRFEVLQGLAFVPMMSLVLRPLGELLTLLPAGQEGSAARAGATFCCPLRVDRLPDASVFRVLERQLGQLAGRLGELSSLDWPRGVLGERARERCAFVAENSTRIYRTFAEEVKES